MNAFGSLVYDSSVTQAWLPEGNPLGPWPGSVCFRLDAFPCEPNVLADRILSPAEREYWRSMRGVEKRRHEWLLGRSVAKEAVRSLLERNLDLHLSPEEIEIMPDPYGRPLVKCGAGPRPAAASHAARGIVEVELRDGALEQCPQLRGKSLNVYTGRESKFVFSSIIYQQGAVRMRPSRQEILDYLLQKLGELTEDWDYPDPVSPESLLFTELGFESLDAVVLCTAVQEHYQTPMPFAELLAEIGQHQRDLSIDELTDFVNTHLGGPAGTGSATRRVQ